MSSKELFDIFYAVPNPHFNAYFEATTGPGDKHPLEDLIEAASTSELSPSGTAVGPEAVSCASEDQK